MEGRLAHLLADRPFLLADGATGTSLFAMGLTAGEAPEMWNLAFPDRIKAHHRAFVAAGSDVILTNSFGGNARRLALHGADERVKEINRAAAILAREVADSAGRPVLTGGSMGPTGDILEPVGTLSIEEATAIFRAQGAALIEGGADVLWVETLSSLEEAQAASRAAATLGAPFCLTMSFDTAGRTMMGVSPADLARAVAGFPYPPLAFGANCGVGAPDLLRSLREFALCAPDAVLLAKANAGVPKFVDGCVHYDGTPSQMARYARLALDLGARIIGGCCGSEPAHVASMHGALADYERGDFPSLARIEAKAGAFTQPLKEKGDAAPRARRRAPGARAGARSRR